MMTKQEELERYIEDRDILEMDIDDLNEQMKNCEIDSPEEDKLYHEITQMENQVTYLTRCIEELEGE